MTLLVSITNKVTKIDIEHHIYIYSKKKTTDTLFIVSIAKFIETQSPDLSYVNLHFVGQTLFPSIPL